MLARVKSGIKQVYSTSTMWDPRHRIPLPIKQFSQSIEYTYINDITICVQFNIILSKVNNKQLIHRAMFCHRRNGALAEDVNGKTEATNNWMADLLPTPIYEAFNQIFTQECLCVCLCACICHPINIFSIQMIVAD